MKIIIEAIDKTPDQNDNCLNVQSSPFPINGIGTGNNYAILSKVTGFDYFKLLNYPAPSFEKRVQKVAHPIIDYFHFGPQSGPFLELHGDILTLCENENWFESYTVNVSQPSSGQFRYTNAFGGIYSLFRPGIPGINHVYFSYPWTSGLWFGASPDLTIKYDNQNDPNFFNNSGLCPTSNIRRAKEELYDVCGNTFYPTANAVFSPVLGNVMDYLVSTDFNTIKDFWSDNVITVGLLGPNAANNYYDFVKGNFYDRRRTDLSRY